MAVGDDFNRRMVENDLDEIVRLARRVISLSKQGEGARAVYDRLGPVLFSVDQQAPTPRSHRREPVQPFDEYAQDPSIPKTPTQSAINEFSEYVSSQSGRKSRVQDRAGDETLNALYAGRPRAHGRSFSADTEGTTTQGPSAEEHERQELGGESTNLETMR